MSAEPIVPPLTELRRRRSVKWQTFADDVLPLFVAEMDYHLAPPVAEALHDAITRSDTGYPARGDELGRAFAGFAARHWDWQVDPSRVLGVGDVSVGVTETLRVLCRPGDRVVLSPPVYFPFYDWLPEVGAETVRVPLTSEHRLDLPALEAAFATRPAVYLLCNPHNPVGRVHTADELTELVSLARRYEVTLVSDEIHGPLVLPGAAFTPLLTVPGAAETAVAVVSASKAFNLAGLKCAAVVTASPRMSTVTERFPFDNMDRLGHLGVLASIAALTGGDDWLAGLLRDLAARRSQLGDLLAVHLPAVTWTPPEATYLAWLRTPFPQQTYLAKARVALEAGSRYGATDEFCRLNFATSSEILEEAIRRMAAVKPSDS